MEKKIEEPINRFIKPIFHKKKKHQFSSWIEKQKLIKILNKTSPSFDMMMEMCEFLSLISQIYMHGTDESHKLYSGTIPKNYDAAMIYREKNFNIKIVLRKEDKYIGIEIERIVRNKSDKTILSFHEGEDVIHSVYDEEKFLFIISCIMGELVNLIEYYYKNKKL